MSIFKKKKDESVKVADIAGQALIQEQPKPEYFTAVNFHATGAVVWLFKRVGEEVVFVSKKNISG